MYDLFEEHFAALSTAFEPNESFSTAAELGEGSHVITGTGQDWFRFDAQAGAFSVTMTPEMLEDNLNMELRNSSNQVIKAGFTPSGSETISYTIPTEGSYYLWIYQAQYGATPPAGTTLEYTLDLNLPQVVAEDGNNTLATATPLGEGRHEILGREVDWFRINSPEGYFSVTMTEEEHLEDPADTRDDPRNLNMELYDASGTFLRANFSSGSSEVISQTVATEGPYYLKVYRAQFGDSAPVGTVLSYTLNVDLPSETDTTDGNDSRAAATRIGAGSHNVSDGSGVDWYRFDTGPGWMDFALTHTGARGPDGQVMNLNLELYDADGSFLRSEFQANADESFSFLSRSSETYYLKVYWAAHPDGAPNGYDLNYGLTLDLPQGSWSVPLDFGPVRNASAAVFDIDNDGKDEIFVGASKALDAAGNEVRPGGLIVLEDDGSVKWTKTFAAHPGPDPVTGLTYQSSSVTTTPVFSDVNNDGSIDVIVGIGADSRSQFSATGQPGDSGGLYALDAQGNVLWHHQTEDSFGHANGGPDGRPDGVYGAPTVFDIDADGVREVIFTSWDHYLYVLDGRNGALEYRVNLHDTAGATPGLADLNRDGLYELVVPADITNNTAAGLPQQGGILHVLSNYGQPNVPGWTTQVGTSTHADYRGQFEEQSLWSSPQIVDLDRDGQVEIVQGTGNFFQDGRGEYVKVWNADGSLRHTLTTEGRVLASPLIADLNGDGSMEIIAATTAGQVHAWNANGVELFSTAPRPNSQVLSAEDERPIARSPIAVDLDADGDLEILLSIGGRVIALDSNGEQLSDPDSGTWSFGTYSGSPVARDIDNDGRLDIIAGGTDPELNQAVIYRWENLLDVQSDTYRTAAYQDSQSLHEIRDFVDRFYDTILGRSADAAGRNDWTDELYAGVRSGADVAYGFIYSAEFQNRGTSDAEYVNILYSAFFDRAADSGGFNAWMARLAEGADRAEVLNGFTGSQEFANLTAAYGIRPQNAFGAASNAPEIVGTPKDTSVLRGGAGNNTLYDTSHGVTEGAFDEAAVAGQVYRLYGATLGRTPDSGGFTGWVGGLTKDPQAGGITLQQAAAAFVGSQEFSNTYGALSNSQFVELLYQNVLNRGADAGGLADWTARLNAGTSRADVVLGFSESAEYQNRTNGGLDSFMRSVEPKWNDVLEGGAGNDTMNGGMGSDTFVFRAGQGGHDVIHGFEPWDVLQLSGFGFANGAAARAHMSQQGSNVVFNYGGQAITFLDTQLSEMTRVQYNVS